MATNLAKTFDQSLLRPEIISTEEIKKAATDAINYGFRGLVVHPCNIELVKSLLSGSSVLAVSVCDFPHGKDLIKNRVRGVKEILKAGADEIDIVSNHQYLKEGNIRNFKKDLKAITKAIGDKVLKIILEVDLLTEKLIKTATQVIAKICEEEKAKIIIKTKTGFSENKFSNLDAVRIIKNTLTDLNQYGEDKIRIKASGGIKSKEEALQLLDTGAHILGVSKGVELIN